MAPKTLIMEQILEDNDIGRKINRLVPYCLDKDTWWKVESGKGKVSSHD